MRIVEQENVSIALIIAQLGALIHFMGFLLVTRLAMKTACQTFVLIKMELAY